jgi:3-dehydroquinate synthase
VSDQQTINVDLGDRSYDIVIGPDLLEKAAKYVGPHLGGSRLAIITDETVADLHLEMLKKGLFGIGVQIETIILPPGEDQKSFAVLQDVIGQLLSWNFGRDDTLIAFGGGVIGDLTGFAASVLKRGCGFIQIPTTLLAQVDSSVGGKTAINTQAGKNLVGAFYQPKLVLTDTNVLKTLPARQMKAGYAEVLKYALINDPDFFEWLETHGEKVLNGEPAALSHAIGISCAAKAAIVKEDEREHGARALLNLGHTFGHALEAGAGYNGTLLHGEAVSAGMLMAFEFSQGQNLCEGQDVQRLRAHLEKLDMPVYETLPGQAETRTEQLFDYMLHDKKNKNSELTLILAEGIGKSRVYENASKFAVLSYLNSL